MAGYIGGGTSLSILTEQDPSVPSQTGNSGKYLTTDGTGASWATVEALPDAIDVNASAPADSLAVDASGNVGIGTSSPTKPLHIYGNSANNHQIRLQNDFGSGADWTLNAYGANGNLYVGNNLDRLVIDSSGNLLFNSGYGSVATAYGCRAWVNFNGTGTVAIRDSGNVSSITDNGTGDYTLNFSTGMVDANYAPTAMGRVWPGVQSEGFVIAFANYSSDGSSQRTTTSLRIVSLNQVTNRTDSPSVHVAIFR